MIIHETTYPDEKMDEINEFYADQIDSLVESIEVLKIILKRRMKNGDEEIISVGPVDIGKMK